MSIYTVIATQEPALFHRLLDRFASVLIPRSLAVAQALPGRLWRIYGPEYASPPYLRPRFFHEYVTLYDRQMVNAIQAHGGYARIHSHGRLRLILDEIAAIGGVGLDPIEPPPQGDMRLQDVRQKVGDQMVLFGNLEASDLENLDEDAFRMKIRQALAEGPGGRGFVLMPSSCPYGRVLSTRALQNYHCMVQEVERYA
jgi:uroporphyrinogen-III decarboxylase